MPYNLPTPYASVYSNSSYSVAGATADDWDVTGESDFKVVQRKLAQVQYKPGFEFHLSGEAESSLTMLTGSGPVIDAEHPKWQIEPVYEYRTFKDPYRWERPRSQLVADVITVIRQIVIPDNLLHHMAVSNEAFLWEIEILTNAIEDHERKEFLRFQGKRVHNPHG